MKILITNDDGLYSEGIQILKEKLSKSPQNEVFVIAPDTNRSAVSHGITLKKTLCIKQEGKNIYTCSGLPVDCILHGLKTIIEKPDIIISGINQGDNLGTDVIYSGTVAAARQGCISKIPSIAVSLVKNGTDWKYEALANFIANNTENLIKLCKPGYFISINGISANRYEGYLFTELSERIYNTQYKKLEMSDKCFFSTEETYSVTSLDNNKSDYNAVNKKLISISIIKAMPNVYDYSLLENLNILL